MTTTIGLNCRATTRRKVLAHARIIARLDKKVGAYLSDKQSCGNITDEDANKRTGFTYPDKLSFLQTPENFEKRVKVWNEVKAAQ